MFPLRPLPGLDIQPAIQNMVFTIHPLMQYSQLLLAFPKLLSVLIIAVIFPQTFVHLSLRFDLRTNPWVSLSRWQYTCCHRVMRESVGANCSCLFFFLKHQLPLAESEEKGLAISVPSCTDKNCLFSPPLHPVFSICSPEVHTEDGGWIWVDKVSFTGMLSGKMPPLTYS